MKIRTIQFTYSCGHIGTSVKEYPDYIQEPNIEKDIKNTIKNMRNKKCQICMLFSTFKGN